SFTIADFPLLKIRPGVYFPFSNTVIYGGGVLPAVPFSACPNWGNSLLKRGRRTDHTLTESRFANAPAKTRGSRMHLNWTSSVSFRGKSCCSININLSKQLSERMGRPGSSTQFTLHSSLLPAPCS